MTRKSEEFYKNDYVSGRHTQFLHIYKITLNSFFKFCLCGGLGNFGCFIFLKTLGRATRYIQPGISEKFRMKVSTFIPIRVLLMW